MRSTAGSLSVLHAACSRFEAARRLDAVPAGHRFRNLHGHGFTATVHARVPEHAVAYAGAEAAALQDRLDACTGLLDYGALNDKLADPSDANLARWIRDRLDAPDVDRVSVQSTPYQGVEIDSRGHAHVWRRYRFQAAHRLPNVPPGHKCGRLHGHGFEVVIHANRDLAGAGPDVDYDLLDRLWAPVAEQIDYRCLNDVPGLSNPTSEMLASWLWQRLAAELPTMSWVTVYETASCGATYDGAIYRIWKDFTIDSAARLRHAPSGDPRHRVHGHTYTLRLHLAAPLDRVMGWTVDFGDVKAVFDPIFRSLDHQPLHERPELTDCDTTTIARWLHARTRRELPQLVRVDLSESAGRGSLVGADLAGPALPASTAF